MDGDVQININGQLVKPIIEAKINAAIVEAFGGKEQLIEGVMDAYMNQKVDWEGKVSGYSSENKFPRFDVLMHKMVEDAMKQALAKYLADKQEKLVAAFEKYFSTKKGAAGLVAALTTGVTNGLSNQWITNITAVFEPPKDRR